MTFGRELFSPTPSSPVEKIRVAYNRAFVNWQAYWVEAYRDQSFYLNNQWTPEERRYLQQEQRPEYTYNLVRACVNMVQGYQRKHRHSLVAQPVENSDSRTADQYTKCLYHVLRNGKGHYAISDAFKGALVTGMGFVGLEMDHRQDPQNGDLKYQFYPWNSIIADPFWTQMDFSDCDYLIRRAYMSKDEAMSKFPDRKEQISRMVGNMRDELFTFLPEQRIFQSQDLLAYTEMWEQQYEEVTVYINPFNLKEVEDTKDNKKEVDAIKALSKVDIPVERFKRQKPKMKFYAMINNELVNEQDNPYNLNTYPFVPVIAVYAPEYDLYQYKMQSMIRCIRDPQIEFNKRVAKITDHLDSQINTGWVVKKSKFDNPMDFYKTGQGRVIFAKNEADVNADARQIMPTPVNQGLFETQQLFNQLIMRIVGVNEELLGAADDDKAGVLAMLRQGAALVNLQDLFDNLRQSQEIIGMRSLQMIQNNWTPEKVARVTKQPPTPDFYNVNMKYDIVCQEAPLTETQQQLFFTQLMNFKEMGAPISWANILKNYPGQGAQEIMEEVQQAEQQQMQMAQMQQQAEMQDKAVVNKLLIDEAQYKIALAKEKLAMAEKDKSAAVYDRVRSLKELDEMEMDNISKFIDNLVKIETLEPKPEEVKE